MGKIVLKLIGIIIMAIGIVCVYDARILTKKFFSSNDTNDATKNLKVVGSIVASIGGIIAII